MVLGVVWYQAVAGVKIRNQLGEPGHSLEADHDGVEGPNGRLLVGVGHILGGVACGLRFPEAVNKL